MIDKEDSQNIDEIARECLDPRCLIKRLSDRYVSETKQFTGHVHFNFRHKSDQIIFVWSMGKLKRIVAKALHCKKNECIGWEASQFSDYKSEDVLREFYKEIECIELDESFFTKKWPSYSEFIQWLAG